MSLQTTAEARERVCSAVVKYNREIIPQFGGQEGELPRTSFCPVLFFLVRVLVIIPVLTDLSGLVGL